MKAPRYDLTLGGMPIDKVDVFFKLFVNFFSENEYTNAQCEMVSLMVQKSINDNLVIAPRELVNIVLQTCNYKPNIEHSKEVATLRCNIIKYLFINIKKTGNNFNQGVLLDINKLKNKLNIKEEDSEILKLIYLSGLLHDIGKSNIPIEILDSNHKLTNQEFDKIKKHPSYGQELIKKLSLVFDLNIWHLAKNDTIGHHDTQPNGSGYSNEYPAEYIHLVSLLSAIDTYDSLRDRTRKFNGYEEQDSAEKQIEYDKVEYDKILSKILSHVGLQFNPEVFELMLSYLSSIDDSESINPNRISRNKDSEILHLKILKIIDENELFDLMLQFSIKNKSENQNHQLRYFNTPEIFFLSNLIESLKVKIKEDSEIDGMQKDVMKGIVIETMNICSCEHTDDKYKFNKNQLDSLFSFIKNRYTNA